MKSSVKKIEKIKCIYALDINSAFMMFISNSWGEKFI